MISIPCWIPCSFCLVLGFTVAALFYTAMMILTDRWQEEWVKKMMGNKKDG